MELLDPSGPEVPDAHAGRPVVGDQSSVPLADERPLSPATREEEVDHQGRHFGAVGVGSTATRGDRSTDPELQREVGVHAPIVAEATPFPCWWCEKETPRRDPNHPDEPSCSPECDAVLTCIDCGDDRLIGPDSEGFMDCPNCGAAWIPGKGEEWHISTGASVHLGLRDRGSGCCPDPEDVYYHTPSCSHIRCAHTSTLPLHRTEAGHPRCSTCDGGGCPDCTDPAW